MRGEILISGCYNAFKSKQERSQNNNNNNSNHKGVYRFVNMGTSNYITSKPLLPIYLGKSLNHFDT